MVMSAARFGQGMTFDEYVRFVASPANLAREGSQGPRRDWSGYLRTAYDAARIPAPHTEAWRWLVAQPGGPARVLALSEEWSSDCRRDIPIVARLADTAGLELRIFTRDGQTVGRAPFPQPDSPNADLMADFLNRRDGETFQSIPILAFYSKDFELLYRYTEFPAVYRKDRIRAAQNRPALGETEAAAQARGLKAFGEMLASPFHEVWRSAALDEWTAMLYERLLVGTSSVNG
jgi:hypothetical protein